MMKSIRVLAPALALAVVVAAGVAAVGNSNASAQQTSISSVRVTQAVPLAAPSASSQAPASTPDIEVNDTTTLGAAPEAPNVNANGTQVVEPADAAGTEPQDNEAADAAALAAKATVTAEQAKATVLASSPSTTVTNAELGDEDGTVIYRIELSNGADVKVDAQSGAIVSTDQAGSDNEQDGETQDGETQDETATTAK